MTNDQQQPTDGEVRYVYGYGRTKHIEGGQSTQRAGYIAGLCGAPGGYPHQEPERPLCKHCERLRGNRT